MSVPDKKAIINKTVIALQELITTNRIVYALVLTILSSVFVEMFIRVGALEYTDSQPFQWSMCRWDCGWYASIVNEGYSLEPNGHPKGDAANWAFFPTFPLFAKFISLLAEISAPLSLIIASKLFLFFSLWTFIALAEEELGGESKLIAGFVLAFNPYIVYAHAGYTETLYFFLTTLAFLLMRKRKYVLVGMAGALLSGTRFVGICFLFSYIINMVKVFRISPAMQWSSLLLGLMIIPLGLAIFMVYLRFHVGDALAFKHVQVAWGGSIGNPITIVLNGLSAGGWQRYYASIALGALGISAWLTLIRKYDYAVFLLIAILVPLSVRLQSMPRYVFWQMPFLFGILELMLRNRALFPLYLVFAGGVGGFVILSWATGKLFVT